jgi:ubiquinone/menaquinone biosynthesis C-methylase UbiE
MNPNGNTAYDAPTSASFAEFDNRLEWTLGYPFALRALGVGGPDTPKTLLDYGCGPGRVANQIARRYDIRIIAVDPSTEMLAIASQRYCHPRITYCQIQDNRLDFLADGSMETAMSCFVFIVLPFRDQLRAIATEVWRVLRPGGRFVVLDPHPDHVGIRFSTGLLRGEPGAAYQDGDPLVARLLLTNGEWLELSDYFWSARTYHEVLTEVGFTDLHVESPVLADAYGLADPADLNAYDYEVERTRAPMILIHGRRPGA